MGRPRRGCGGGLGMRSIRPISWTRTVSWAIMGGPPRVACLDTRHPRRFLASEQVLMRFSIYDRPSIRLPLAFLSGALYVGLGGLRIIVAENAGGQEVLYLVVAACLAVDYDGVVASSNLLD